MKAGGNSTGQAAEALVKTLLGNPTALQALAQAVGAALASQGMSGEGLHGAIEAHVKKHAAHEAGRLLAGTVSTLAGALIAGPPHQAMVFLSGAATAVIAYVPPHIQTSIAAGQDVWVEPVNGSKTDLMIVAIRNI